MSKKSTGRKSIEWLRGIGARTIEFTDKGDLRSITFFETPLVESKPRFDIDEIERDILKEEVVKRQKDEEAKRRERFMYHSS